MAISLARAKSKQDPERAEEEGNLLAKALVVGLGICVYKLMYVR